MRKRFMKLTVIIVMLVTFLCSSQQTFAMETLNSLSKNEEAESVLDSFGGAAFNDVKEDIEQSKLPVFFIIVDYEGEQFLIHSFYVKDSYRTGGSYLISSCAAYIYERMGADLYAVIDGNTYEVECLGEKDSISYLKCAEISNYTAIDLKEKVTDKSLFAVQVAINADKKIVLETKNVDISSWKDNNGFFSSGAKLSNLLDLGVPLLDKSSYEMVGMLELYAEKEEIVMLDLTQFSFNESYALATDTPKESTEPVQSAESEPTESAPATQEPEQSSESEPEEPEVSESKPEQPATAEPEKSESEPAKKSDTSSSVPEWAYIAIIVVIAAAIYLSKNQKKKEKKLAEKAGSKKEYPKDGTISLDRNETVRQEATIKNVPAEPAWQIRGMNGAFMGQTFALTDVLRFGRNPQNQVAFPQNTKGISGSHCELSMENGRIVLRDLGSTYGTYLKTGEKINARVACELKEGDIFYLAESSQSFRVERVGESRQQFTPAVKAAMYPKAGEIYRADASGRLQFGRSANSQVSFGADDSKISTSHCVLYRENGALYLMDLGSTNGTYFSENKRLQPNLPYRVEKGMAFFLTSQNYLFVIVED